MMKIELVRNNLIKQHERTRKGHLKKLTERIKNDGYLNNPIVVDKNTMVLLDGHHRLNALKILGLMLIPVHFVDYKNKSVRVSSWKKGKTVTKPEVIKAGLSGELLNPKTSRHFIPLRPAGLRIPLAKLAF